MSYKVAVKAHNWRLWFEDGMVEMMQIYKLESPVLIHYKYTDSDYLLLRIWQKIGRGEVQYPKPVEEPQEIIHIDDDEEEVPSAASQILWKSVLTKAQEESRQGLVLPVSIVTELLHKNQKVFPVKVPSGEVQPWALLWNKKIEKHCRLSQGWYQFCRTARLKAGDELTFWKFEGAEYIGLQVKTARN
ncbi:DNA-binding barrel domain superfamily [Sesbania bispinosa]|nr:DNA-binding barrel domain superfamily [Sesbania bispinosa]